MSDTIFTADERKVVEARTRRRGFESLRDYMRALIDINAAEHGEPLPLEPTRAEIREGIRGLREALRGEQVSLETLRAGDAEL